MTGPRHGAARGSLLRVEVARLTARRFIQIIAALAALGFVVLAVLSFINYSKPTAEVLAEAEARRDADLVLFEQYRQDCLADETLPEEEREFICGEPQTVENLPIEFYIDTPPFTLENDLPAGGLAVAAATAMIGFVIGATYVGAEWSTRSMVALLFWEPRRLTVIGVKTVVAAAAGALLALVGQLAWFGLARVLAAARGAPEELPAGFWGDVVGQGGRSVLLGVVATLLGFGLANLIRNTGAALGVGFAYFAVVESAVRGFRPQLQPFLVTDSSAALLLDGGLTVFIYEPTVDESGIQEFTELVVSNLRGGLTLAAYTVVLLAVGSWLFRRRDLH